MPSNVNLEVAKRRKNDEFYTSYECVERELSKPSYEELLRGKRVYCNTDNPYTSNFVRYFTEHFDALGLKSLTASCVANEYQPALVGRFGAGKTMRVAAINEGDFRERGDLLASADVVITNPPFSQMRRYLEVLFDARKDFLIIAPLTIIRYLPVFERLRDGKLRAVCNSSKRFEMPNHSHLVAMSNTFWLTTLPVPYPPPVKLGRYGKRKFPNYDNFDAIEVKSSKNIPKYKGLMGLPISFCYKYNPKQFGLLGLGTHLRCAGKQVFARMLAQLK